MEINANFEKKNFSFEERLGTSQVVVECDIDTASKGGLKKILSVSGDAEVNKAETLVGEAKISGRVNYKIIFTNHDNELMSLDYFSDFVESIGSGDVTATSIVRATAKLVDIDVKSVADKIKLQAATDIMLFGIKSDFCDALTDVENALVKCENQEFSSFAGHGEECFELHEDYETGANVDKVIVFDSNAIVSNVKPGSGSILVQGEASVSITYMSDGRLVVKNFRLPYSEELKMESVSPSSRVIAHVAVKDSKIVLHGVEDNNVIKIELTLKVVANAFDYASEVVAVDAYSPKCELDFTIEKVMSKRIVGAKSIEERISGEMTLDNDMASIRRVVATCLERNVMTNTVISEGDVQIDGLMNTTVIYEEEEGEFNSVGIEMPYSINMPFDVVEPNDAVKVNIVIMNVSSRVRREREIEVVAEICVEAIAEREHENRVIRSIEATAEKIDTHKAITVYFAVKGDTSWDVIKALGVYKDKIEKMNEGIDLDSLVGGERILAFRSLA